MCCVLFLTNFCGSQHNKGETAPDLDICSQRGLNSAHFLAAEALRCFYILEKTLVAHVFCCFLIGAIINRMHSLYRIMCICTILISLSISIYLGFTVCAKAHKNGGYKTVKFETGHWEFCMTSVRSQKGSFPFSFLLFAG